MKKHFTYQSRVNIAAAVAILSIFLIIFQFFFLGYKLRKEALINSRHTALLASKEVTNSIQLYFRDALSLTINYVDNFLVYKKNKVPRGNIYQLLKSSLTQNDKFLAIWTMWEPNAYDSNDKFYANDSIHDPKGTFAIAYYYDNGIIKHEINDTLDFLEDFYTQPKNHLHTLIIDPFDYQYHGNPKTFYETSLIHPIIENDIFLGVIGIDIDLNDLIEQYRNIRVYDNGYISLLSNSGQIVTHSNLKYVRQNINQILQGKNTATLDSMKLGKTFVSETISEFTGEKVMRFFFPINLEYSPTPWYIMVETPLNEILQYANRLLIVSSIMLALSLILLIYLIFNSVDLRKKERMLLLALSRAENSETELKTYQNQLEKLVLERTEEYNCANEELNAVNEELYRYKNELEKLVEQRTNELRESEAKFRSIFNISPDAIYIGVQEGPVIEINPAVCFLIGYTAEEIKQKSPMDFVPEKYHQRIKDRRELLKNKEELGFIEIEVIHKDGSLIPVEINNRVIKVGNTDCWLTVIRDLRDRKIFQQKLVDTIIETEEKERRKFAGDLHDELGPQLAAMRIYASTIKRRVVDAEQLQLFEELMEMIKKSILNVREISGNLSPHLLDTYGLVAAIESEIENKRGIFSVNFEQNINETRFEINKEIALYRIVKELLNNTMKYAKATRVDISMQFNCNKLYLTYTDNGLGCDIDEILKTKHEGIGLLNIQYRINSLQGNCTIFSKTNQGFSIHIDFPAQHLTI